MRSSPRYCKGATFTEILVASLLFSFTILAVANGFLNAQKSLRQSLWHSQASSLLDSMANDIKAVVHKKKTDAKIAYLDLESAQRPLMTCFFYSRYVPNMGGEFLLTGNNDEMTLSKPLQDKIELEQTQMIQMLEPYQAIVAKVLPQGLLRLFPQKNHIILEVVWHDSKMFVVSREVPFVP